MRIAVLTSTYPHGETLAAAPFLPPFLDSLGALGHETITFFPTIGEGAPASASEIPVQWTSRPRPLIGLSPANPADLADLLRLLKAWGIAVREEHRQQPFDLVFALWAVPAGLVARNLHRRENIPYAVWSLGSDINTHGRSLLTRPILVSVLRDAAILFANSQTLCERIHALSGCQCEFLATSRPIGPPPPGLCHEGTVFLFVGRLETVKGPDVLLEAAGMLQDGDWRLIFVGDGSMRVPLEQRAKSDTRLRDRVLFEGHLAGDALVRRFYEADCIVIPSRSESMPVTLSEGLQAGKPFIVADVGDPAAIVSRYGLGQVVPASCPERLAHAMQRFMERPHDLFFDRSGQREALALLDISQSARRFSEVVEELPPGSKASLKTAPDSKGGSTNDVERRGAGARRWLVRALPSLKVFWVLVAVTILVFLARSLLANWANLHVSLGQLRWDWLLLSALFFALGYGVSALLWHESLVVFDSSPGFRRALEIILLSQLPKYLPGGFWAIVGLVELAKKAGVRRSVSLASVGLISAAQVLSGLIFGVAVGLDLAVLGRTRLLAVGAGVVLAAVFMHPSVFSRVVRASFRLVGQECPPMSLSLGQTIWLLLVALLHFPLAGLGLYFMAAALVPLSPSTIPSFMGAYALSWTIGYVAIFAPGGLGVREGIMVLLLTTAATLPVAILVSLAQRVWLTVIELVLAGLWLARRGLEKRYQH